MKRYKIIFKLTKNVVRVINTNIQNIQAEHIQEKLTQNKHTEIID